MANLDSLNERRCSRTVLDTTVPGILFDENGVANYCKIHNKLAETYPRGKIGKQQWERSVRKIKNNGGDKSYDCIIGISGGTDSSFLLHIAHQYGLRPLAVYLDNGWSSEISVSNIKKMTDALKIDLQTYVIDYNEIKDILKSYMKAGLPWIDGPTDIAIRGCLYRIAAREKIKYILLGSDFRSEGKQPREWTYSDGKQLKYIGGKFGTVPLKTFPNYTLSNMLFYSFIKWIKVISPFYFLEYNKEDAQKLLESRYGWRYYGGHHHESAFTKFVVSYWLPKKFKIDKRKITLSAQIMSGHITREQAIAALNESPYDKEQMENDKEFVIKKLGLTPDEFKKIWNSPNRTFLDYPSYYPFLEKILTGMNFIIRLFLKEKPLLFYELEIRKNT